MQRVKRITKKEARIKAQMKKVIMRWSIQARYPRVATRRMWSNVVSLKAKRTHWKSTSGVTHHITKVTIKADNKKNMKGAGIFNKERVRPTKANLKKKGSLVVKVGTQTMADVHKNELMVGKKNVTKEEKPTKIPIHCVQRERDFMRHSANSTDTGTKSNVGNKKYCGEKTAYNNDTSVTEVAHEENMDTTIMANGNLNGNARENNHVKAMRTIQASSNHNQNA
jgi:hypothetical protein